MHTAGPGYKGTGHGEERRAKREGGRREDGRWKANDGNKGDGAWERERERIGCGEKPPPKRRG